MINFRNLPVVGVGTVVLPTVRSLEVPEEWEWNQSDLTIYNVLHVPSALCNIMGSQPSHGYGQDYVGFYNGERMVYSGRFFHQQDGQGSSNRNNIVAAFEGEANLGVIKVRRQAVESHLHHFHRPTPDGYTKPSIHLAWGLGEWQRYRALVDIGPEPPYYPRPVSWTMVEQATYKDQLPPDSELSSPCSSACGSALSNGTENWPEKNDRQEHHAGVLQNMQNLHI